MGSGLGSGLGFGHRPARLLLDARQPRLYLTYISAISPHLLLNALQPRLYLHIYLPYISAPPPQCASASPIPHIYLPYISPISPRLLLDARQPRLRRGDRRLRHACEIQGRYRGDIGEIWGRYREATVASSTPGRYRRDRGVVQEIHGRYRADAWEIRATPARRVKGRVRCKGLWVRVKR